MPTDCAERSSGDRRRHMLSSLWVSALPDYEPEFVSWGQGFPRDTRALKS